jgi:hypothetical protein
MGQAETIFAPNLAANCIDPNQSADFADGISVLSVSAGLGGTAPAIRDAIGLKLRNVFGPLGLVPQP